MPITLHSGAMDAGTFDGDGERDRVRDLHHARAGQSRSCERRSARTRAPSPGGPDSAQGTDAPCTRGCARHAIHSSGEQICTERDDERAETTGQRALRARKPFEDLSWSCADSVRLANASFSDEGASSTARRLRARRATRGAGCAAKRMQGRARPPRVVARERDERPRPQRADAVEEQSTATRRRGPAGRQDHHVGGSPHEHAREGPGTSACVMTHPASSVRDRARADARGRGRLRGSRRKPRRAPRVDLVAQIVEPIAAARALPPARRSARGGDAPRAPTASAFSSAAITAMRLGSGAGELLDVTSTVGALRSAFVRETPREAYTRSRSRRGPRPPTTGVSPGETCRLDHRHLRARRRVCRDHARTSYRGPERMRRRGHSVIQPVGASSTRCRDACGYPVRLVRGGGGRRGHRQLHHGINVDHACGGSRRPHLQAAHHRRTADDASSATGKVARDA